MSMQPPPVQKKVSSDDDYLRQQWANHLKKTFKVREGEEAHIVAKILERSGSSTIKTKEDICRAYTQIRKSFEPDFKKIYIVDRARDYFERFEYGRPTKVEQQRAQAALIDDIVARYGYEYENVSNIGRDYLLNKEPEDKDYIVDIWSEFLKLYFETNKELEEAHKATLDSIVYFFGNVQNETEVIRWYMDHRNKTDPELHPTELKFTGEEMA